MSILKLSEIYEAQIRENEVKEGYYKLFHEVKCENLNKRFKFSKHFSYENVILSPIHISSNYFNSLITFTFLRNASFAFYIISNLVLTD